MRLTANRDGLYRLAVEQGIATATTEGRPPLNHLINSLNKPEYRGGIAKFTKEQIGLSNSIQRDTQVLQQDAQATAHGAEATARLGEQLVSTGDHLRAATAQFRV